MTVLSAGAVRATGPCDGEMAWCLREDLQALVDRGQRRIRFDVAGLRFTDFSAVAIVIGAIVRIRRVGAEVAVFPPTSGAYQVLKRGGPHCGRERVRSPAPVRPGQPPSLGGDGSGFTVEWQLTPLPPRTTPVTGCAR